MNKIAIISSAPVIHKENRSLFGKCDPERHVVKKASSTFSAPLPLLANFSLDSLPPHPVSTHSIRTIEQQSFQKGFGRFTYHYIDKHGKSDEMSQLQNLCVLSKNSANVLGNPLLSIFNFSAVTKPSVQAILLK